MRILRSTDRAALARIVNRDAARNATVERDAARIVDDVRARGDKAVLAWTNALDHARGGQPRMRRIEALTRAALSRGWKETPAPVRRALALAVRNLEAVAARQVPKPFTVTVAPGHRIEQRVRPLPRVGCYVPGGRYPLPSTLLMTAVPARVAGVKDVVVVCPSPAPVVLAAAVEAGVSEIYTIGGAQAIGALAYGTSAIPRVSKIVGPGNAWVAAAKAYVSRDCPIDLHAGPSEIVVSSDGGRAEWIAADLIAQAEHDPEARAIFVTTKTRLALAVAREVARQTPADGPASTALRANGAIVIARNRRDAVAVVDALAPEHLVIDSDDDADRYGAAGTIFVGDYSVQAAGDYCTGSNHVLPTGGAARFRGGLGAADFVRVFSVQTLTAAALKRIGPSVVALAEAEGLSAHANSVRARL